ncbi:porin family protein [Maribacter sp. R77961]|uniref:porin family protein n=1 Tax=Maribacter sp. R77961 TaxID=3093871 RepID=UPI0037C97D84
MKSFLCGVLFCVVLQVMGQSPTKENTANTRYFEDQFYFGITYNFVRNKAEDFKQRNLSYGLNAGFIKDIPLNSTGTRALGLGAGLAINNYYSNLVVRDNDAGLNYIFDTAVEGFRRSKLETHLVEFPLEFRWRTSSAEEYKFWRIYAGVKAAYAVGARSKLVTDDFTDGFFNSDIRKFQYGLTLNVGYNTFNIHVYYSLTDLFEDSAVVNGESIGFRPLRIGFIFYIL